MLLKSRDRGPIDSGRSPAPSTGSRSLRQDKGGDERDDQPRGHDAGGRHARYRFADVVARVFAHRLFVTVQRNVYRGDGDEHDERWDDIPQRMMHHRGYGACVAIKSCIGLDALA